MKIWKVEKMCLSCRHYRPKDVLAGICRVDREKSTDYPVKLHEDVCERWKDCGQQYHIRAGWVKGQAKAETEKQQ